MVKSNFRPALWFFLLLSLSACIKEVDFDTGEPPQLLVVDGRITTNDGPQSVRLSQVSAYGSQVRVPVSGAAIRLFDEDGFLADYFEAPDEAGLYTVERLQGRVGSRYHVEIRLPGERTYRSLPEPLLPVPKADSLSYETVFEETQNPSGVVQNKWFINVYAHTTLEPRPEEGPYLKWEVETVHNFVPVFVGPFPPPPPYICYITEPHNPQDILIYDGADITTPQPIQRQVGRRQIDWVLDWRHFFNVYQYSLSERAYRYWSNIDLSSNQTGTIFDVPPAAVRGNVVSEQDEQELVLGYFGAVAVDTVRLATVGADFGAIPITPYCGNDFFRPSPLPAACINCRLLPNSSYDRPDYF